ncbi:MAG TPA: DUF6081 family protein [Candidatus Dormibacteraeota bacterium]|jgi:hypothetical protein|nr:DUF6081 family protein [Candidatus Dormibacteraeota bacterium]
MLTTETLYDDMSKGKIDPTKWKILSFPMGNGETWTWKEPKARIEPKSGGLAITVDPFTRKHDKVHMFDDPKQLYGSTRAFPVSPDRETVFEVEMGCETYRSNWGDLRDGFAGFILMDFSTGMIFDFISTGRKIGAIYERLLIPGVTDEKKAFTHLIESPFSGVWTEPGKLHHYTVRIDASKKRAQWLADGKPFFKAEGIPAAPKEIMIGFGLFTLNPVHPDKGSTSVHGQGATGIWKNFKYYTA